MLKNFRYLTSGESHGRCLNGIIDGVPSGFKISIEEINSDLKRRQGGYGRGGRMQIEADNAIINSGIIYGETTGAPICIEITNKDHENWKNIITPYDTENKDFSKAFHAPRPGHADYAGAIKYDRKDLRDILERSSARRTAMDVAIGSIAKQILKVFNIEINSNIISVGGKTTEEEIKNKIDEVKEKGDTLGGEFSITIKNVPVGLGSHIQWDKKLDGILAQNIMSIPAVKSIEIGFGKECANHLGSEIHDELILDKGKIIHKTNNAGGIEGGISNGEDIVIKAVMKPIPTLKIPLQTVDLKENKQTEAHFERSDTCAVEACSVVAEAVCACVILDVFLDKFGGDSINEIKRNYKL